MGFSPVTARVSFFFFFQCYIFRHDFLKDSTAERVLENYSRLVSGELDRQVVYREQCRWTKKNAASSHKAL